MKASSHLKFFMLYTMLIFESIAATSIKLEITNDGKDNPGNTTVTVGVPFEVTATVIDGDRDTGSLELTGPDHIRVLSTGRRNQIETINGNFTSKTSYIFQLEALQEGSLTLGPAHVRQSNQEIESNALDLVVNKAAEQKATVLCRLTADKKTAVVGEAITIRQKLLSSNQIIKTTMEPARFPGFTVKDIPNMEQRKETYNGTQYNIVEKKYIIIPTEPGVKTIEPIRAECSTPAKQEHRQGNSLEDVFFAGLFGQTRFDTKTVMSDALTLTISPLPENQGPIDGVGSFTTFTAHINKKEAHVNEALTLKLELSGEGNFDQITAPRLIIPPFMKAYDSKTLTDTNPNPESQQGKKVFEYIIQIAQEGDAEIPPQQFTYFDTIGKAVKTIKTAPLTVHLTPTPQTQKSNIARQKQAEEPEEEEAPVQQKKGKKDINFIQEDGPIMHRTGSGLNLLLLLLLLLFIPGVILGQSVIRRIKKALLPELFKKRSHKKNLEQLHKEFEMLEHKKQVDKLYQFFVKFLAMKCHVDIETITHDWLQEYLTTNQWEEKKIHEFFDFLNECASCHFVAATHTNINHEELLKKGSYWLLLLSK